MAINYGTLIKTRRTELGLTQKELAERVGCHRTLIGLAERDAGHLKFATFQKILYELYLNINITEE